MENIARDRIPGPFGYRYETPPASGEVHPAFKGTGVSFYDQVVRGRQEKHVPNIVPTWN